MRSSFALFNKPNLYSTKSNVGIPGLRFVKNFFSESERTQLIFLLQDLRKNLNIHSNRVPFTISKKHNLTSEEKYKNVILTDGKRGQFFPNYGEEGHELTYFIGNKNMPGFIKERVVSRLYDLDEIKALQQQKHSVPTLGAGLPTAVGLDWNLTFNTYLRNNTASNLIAGFPFHIDIASNGEITLICSITSTATLELRKKGEQNASHSISLTQGSLLLLSNEARWEWEHRLLKTENGDTRFSLVFGCR